MLRKSEGGRFVVINWYYSLQDNIDDFTSNETHYDFTNGEMFWYDEVGF